MKYSIPILCLLISSPVFAKDEPVNLKSISQMGADMVDSATQGIYETLATGSRNIAGRHCAFPTNQEEMQRFSIEPCLHQPAFAGARQTELALRQKEPQISEGGREVQNLSDQIIDSLGLRSFVE
ncbi:hypothetical protein A7P89_09740 [Eikenella corrodens]|uniref:UrcA family protein n=1 Tax=Eikenella corrodens TaxID=539 RepID=A0A1A9RKP6_EIKCO|nr:hypothetical protein [Eikenella corrodens]OAM20611.1 hypothetical protein A7P89_09740 [Eikenella corrodens]